MQRGDAMNRKAFVWIVFAICALTVPAGPARGDENNKLAASYGYALINPRINTVSYAGASGDIVLQEGELSQGQAVITVRLSNLDKVDKLLFSEDDGRTWNEIPKTQDITYALTPLPDKAYQPVLKIKTTDIQELVLKVFPNVDHILYKTIDEGAVVQAVKAIADAYEMRDLGKFTGLISSDFMGDKNALEDGVRFDFELFSNIHLVIYIDRIDKRNQEFFVDTSWQKHQAPIKTGQQQATTGETKMTFALEQGQLKLKNLKGNLIYATLSPDIAKTSGLNAFVVSEIINAANTRNPIQPGAATSSGSFAAPSNPGGGQSAVASVSLTNPHGGEFWSIATNHAITWTIVGSVTNVKLEYSTAGSGGPWTTIVASTPAAAGTYTWSIPPTPSGNVFVRVTDVSISSVTSMNFIPFSIG